MDLELLSALVQARLWEASYNYGLPDLLRPRGADALALVRRLCDTGRFLHDNMPDAHLTWSDARPTPRLGWHMSAEGSQRLGFVDEADRPLDLRGMEGTSLWVDAGQGRIGAPEHGVGDHVLRLVQASPEVTPQEAERLGAALPDTLGGLALPRPRNVRQIRRQAKQRNARLTLGAETARDGPHYFGSSVSLPTLTLRFFYDGQEAEEGGPDIRMVEAGRS